MSNKLLLAVMLITFLIGGAAGFAVKQWATPAAKQAEAETKTVFVEKEIPVKVVQVKYLEMPAPETESISTAADTTKREIFSVNAADSIAGCKDSVNYKVYHKFISLKDSLKSIWRLDLAGLYKEKTREVIKTEFKEIPVSKPFYTNGWFWATFIAVPLLVLAIIF